MRKESEEKQGWMGGWASERPGEWEGADGLFRLCKAADAVG